MGNFGEFQSDLHRDLFFDQAQLYRRGGPLANVCGANTKTGKPCQNAPIRDGNGRCLLHCGPKVARLVRDRQIADLAAGRITQEEWQALEGRRVRNRLQNKWKVSPWFPGQTIVLGEHEMTFRAHCAEFGVRLELLAPAVLDWLRWKFRRLMLDRREDQKWAHAVRVELPVRVQRAGPMPEGWTPTADYAVIEEAVHDAERPVVGSKRLRPNHPVRKAETGVARRLRPGRPPSADRVRSDMEDLSALFHENREALGPLFEKCRGVDEQRELLVALRDYKARPNDRAARLRWFDLVTALMARRG